MCDHLYHAFRYLTFDALSSATAIGHQRNHQSLLNSNISKLIHDQGIQTSILFFNLITFEFLKAKLHFVGHFQFLQCFVRVWNYLSKLCCRRHKLKQRFKNLTKTNFIKDFEMNWSCYRSQKQNFFIIKFRWESIQWMWKMKLLKNKNIQCWTL